MTGGQALRGLALFEMRIGWRMLRVWILGLLVLFLGGVASAYYAGLHYVSGFVGPGGFITEDLSITMPAIWMGALAGLVGIFQAFDWRHRDVASLFSPTLDASPLGALSYAWGKFLGLLLPLSLPFVLLSLLQLLVLPLFGFTVRPTVLLAAVLLFGLLPAASLTAVSFGLAGLTGSRAIAVLGGLALLGGSFAIAFTMPEWTAVLVGGLIEVPIHSRWIGFEANPIVWVQRAVLLVQIAFFVSLGACGRFGAARGSGLQSRHLALAVTGGAWLFSLGLLWLIYSAQGSERRAILEAEARVAERPVVTVLHRDISVSLEPGRGLSGTAALRLRNDTGTALDSLVLSLNAGLEVDSVNLDGAAATHERDLTVIELRPSSPMAPGSEALLEIAYSGEPEASSVDADVALDVREMEPRLRGNRRFIGTLPLVFDRRMVLLGTDARWYPEPGVRFGHDFPDRQQPRPAPARLEVKVPAGWTAASVGVRSGGDGRFLFESEVPVPGLSLNAAAFAEIVTEVEGITFRVLHHPKKRRNVDFFAEAGGELRKTVSELLEEVESRTGLRYPHPELSLVEAPQQVAAYEGGWDAPSRLAAPGVVMLREGGVFGARFEQVFKAARSRFEKDSGGGGGGGVRVRVSVGDAADESAAAKGESTAAQGESAAAEGDAAATEGDSAATDGAAEDESELTTFDPASAKRDILLKYVKTDWAGGDIPQMAFRSAWAHRVRTEDAAAPILDFALASFLGELAFRRTPFDSPEMIRILNGPQAQMAIGASLQGRDPTPAIIAGIADMDQVYETMVTTPLNEVDPREMGADFLGLMYLKGREPLRALHETLGRERWNAAMLELLEEHADGTPLEWGRFRSSILDRVDSEQRAEVETLFENWLEGTELPGFVVTRQVAQRLAGERERWQVRAVVANKGSATGVAKLTVGTGDGARSRLLSLAPGDEVEVGILTPDKPRTWRLSPYLALNRSEPSGTLELREEPVEAEPFEGTRPAEVLGAAAPVVVDNQDPGFTVTLADGRQVAWDAREGDDELLPKLNAFGLFGKPRKWSRWRSQPRGYQAFGLFDLTAAVKGATDAGAQPARWRASLPEPGTYRVEAFLPPSTGAMGRRVVPAWSFAVRGEDGEEAITISTDAAEEGWNDLGRFRFGLEGEVLLLDRGEEGIVIADAVRFVREAS